MSAELITYGADRRLVLANAEVIRAPIYLDDWAQIRIGLRGAWTNVAATIAGTPRFAFGVCNGSSFGYGSSLSANVLGYRTNHDFTRTVGTIVYINPFSGGSGKFFNKVGATISDVAITGGSNGYFSADSAVRSYVGLQITRGSPNFTLQMTAAHTGTEVAIDVTDDKFTQYMEQTPLLASAGHIASNVINVPVDEVTNGVLNYFFIYWERTVQQFGFDIKHRKIS